MVVSASNRNQNMFPVPSAPPLQDAAVAIPASTETSTPSTTPTPVTPPPPYENIAAAEGTNNSSNNPPAEPDLVMACYERQEEFSNFYKIKCDVAFNQETIEALHGKKSEQFKSGKKWENAGSALAVTSITIYIIAILIILGAAFGIAHAHDVTHRFGETTEAQYAFAANLKERAILYGMGYAAGSTAALATIVGISSFLCFKVARAKGCRWRYRDGYFGRFSKVLSHFKGLAESGAISKDLLSELVKMHPEYKKKLDETEQKLKALDIRAEKARKATEAIAEAAQSKLAALIFSQNQPGTQNQNISPQVDAIDKEKAAAEEKITSELHDIYLQTKQLRNAFSEIDGEFLGRFSKLYVAERKKNKEEKQARRQAQREELEARRRCAEAMDSQLKTRRAQISSSARA